tara:strand:+ start:1041 stop:1448 length:408 start_codon:yes stop_codon:yes gene_type:complete
MLNQNNDINSDTQINILPMIDIIFAILSFLIVSTLYLSKIDTIPVDLPEASSSIKQDKEFIIISIDNTGNIFINQKKILINDLTTKILNLINEDSKNVVLNADKNVSFGVLIKVLDSLRSIEGLKIAISTKYIKG